MIPRQQKQQQKSYIFLSPSEGPSQQPVQLNTDDPIKLLPNTDDEHVVATATVRLTCFGSRGALSA